MSHALVVQLPRVVAAAVACVICKRLLFRQGRQQKPETLVRQPSLHPPKPEEPTDLSSVPVEELTAESGPSPQPDPEFKEIAACDLPCNVQQFFALVLSSRSNVILETHKACGQFDFAKGRWQKCADSAGLERSFNFVTPVSGPVGPKQTRVAQHHEVHLYSDGVLVYCSTQQNLDIPFKECFSVKLAWRLTPAASSGGCHLSVRLAVPFTKWCAFKGIIQSTTTKETTAFFQLLVKNIQQAVAEAPASTPAPAPSTSAAATSAPVATPATTTTSTQVAAPAAGDGGGVRRGGVLGKVLVVAAVMCCAVQLWVFSQVWAVGAACGAGVRPVRAVEEGHALAGAGAAVVSLLMCLMLIK